MQARVYFIIIILSVIVAVNAYSKPQKPHYEDGVHNDNYDDPNDIGSRVEKLINDNKVMIFSKSYCPYCAKAKHLYSNLNVEYNVIEIDQDAHGKEIQHYLLKRTNQRTVPNIFINHKHFGGADKSVEYFNNGELFKLLDEAGAQYSKPQKA